MPGASVLCSCDDDVVDVTHDDDDLGDESGAKAKLLADKSRGMHRLNFIVSYLSNVVLRSVKEIMK